MQLLLELSAKVLKKVSNSLHSLKTLLRKQLNTGNKLWLKFPCSNLAKVVLHPLSAKKQVNA
jgi:hypothetical protein